MVRSLGSSGMPTKRRGVQKFGIPIIGIVLEYRRWVEESRERELERSHWDLRNGVGILKVKGNDKGGKQRPTEVKSTGFET